MRRICFSLSISLCCYAQSYTKDIAPTFEARCLGCHASKVNMGSLDLETFGYTAAVVIEFRARPQRIRGKQ